MNNERPRVFLVDDDEMVLAAMEDQLCSFCDCVTVHDPRRALALLAEQPFDVIVSDQVMPHLSGDQLLAKVNECWPEIERILITGQADTRSVARAVNQGQIFYYLSKPWDAGQLIEAVQKAYKRARERRQHLEVFRQACQERNQALQALEESRAQSGRVQGDIRPGLSLKKVLTRNARGL